MQGELLGADGNATTTELQTEKNTENVTKEELDHYSEYLGETSTTQSSLIQDYSDDKRETEQAESKNNEVN